LRNLAPSNGLRTKALHDEYAQPIFNYCLRRLRSREEAEDAAQIVFLNAHRCLEEGILPQSERAWLFKIAEHVVMYRRRTISRRARVEFPIDVDSLADLVVAPGREVPSELDELPEALARIPEAQQRAIVLREWYGLSYREVAAELGISASAAETLIFRARRRLAQELGGPAPTTRRRTPLGLASPMLPLSRWLFGGTTALKAIAGVTSVAVIAAGTSKVGLLQRPAPRAAMPSVSQTAVAPAATRSQRAVPAHTSVSRVVLPIRTAGARVRYRPAPAAVATARVAVVAVTPEPAGPEPPHLVAPSDPADSWASASVPPAGALVEDDRSEASAEPQLAASVEVLSMLMTDVQLPAVAPAAGGPVVAPPANPGKSGDNPGNNNGQGTPGEPAGPPGAGQGNNNGQGTRPAEPPAAGPGNNNGQGTPGGPAGPPGAGPGNNNGQGNPGGPAGPSAAIGGDPQNGDTLPRPANEAAPDISALPASATKSESHSDGTPIDSSAKPGTGGDGSSPAQAQGDPAGPTAHEPSSQNDTGIGGNGAGPDTPAGA
jgi:RNA polymerase sigma factor (sigma-70 family)